MRVDEWPKLLVGSLGRDQRDVPAVQDVSPVGSAAQDVEVVGPHITVEQLDPSDSAMLILPGADTWLAGRNTRFVDAASRFLEAGVPVAAICGATVGLANAGLLNDRVHTSNAAQILESDGYQGHDRYRYDLAVIDGDLITASGIAPVEFARAIFERLAFYNRTINDNWYLLYGQHDAAGFFGLMEAAGHAG